MSGTGENGNKPEGSGIRMFGTGSKSSANGSFDPNKAPERKQPASGKKADDRKKKYGPTKRSTSAGTNKKPGAKPWSKAPSAKALGTGTKPGANAKPETETAAKRQSKPAETVGKRPAQSAQKPAETGARTEARSTAVGRTPAQSPTSAREAVKAPQRSKPTSAAERVTAKKSGSAGEASRTKPIPGRGDSDRSAGIDAPGSGRGGEAPRRRKMQVTAREAALNVLAGVDESGAYSNLLLNRTLQQAELSPADAGLATELVYGTIARQATLDYFLNLFIKSGVKRLNPWVRGLMRMSLYQIKYLDRIPPHAAVNEAVEIAKKRGHQGIASMVNGVLRSVLREGDVLEIPNDLPTNERIALQHSHPQWLVERWIAQYGEETAEAVCAANNEPPKVSIRINSLRGSREELLQELTDEGRSVRASELSPQGVIVESGGNMANDRFYRDGRFSIQDESSMLVAEALAPEPGMSVLDCCAAPGGKTVHIAEKMKNHGRIVANDLHEHKQKLIAEQAERLGLSAIETSVGDALSLKDRFEQASFDRVLLDAPCSGFGVIRRKPDLRWAKTPDDAAAIARLQRQLLSSVAGLVKPGGILVYSTCTIEREENQRAVAEFLRDHADFVAEPFDIPALENIPQAGGAGVQILPHQFGSDGFYIARLRRRG